MLTSQITVMNSKNNEVLMVLELTGKTNCQGIANYYLYVMFCTEKTYQMYNVSSVVAFRANISSRPKLPIYPISVLCKHPDFCDMIRRLWFDSHDSTERLPSSKQERTWGFYMRIYGVVWFIINICMEVRKRKQQIAFLQIPLLCQKSPLV